MDDKLGLSVYCMVRRWFWYNILVSWRDSYVSIIGLSALTGCDVTLSVAGKMHNQDSRQCIYDATSVRCTVIDYTLSKMPATAIALNVVPIIGRSVVIMCDCVNGEKLHYSLRNFSKFETSHQHRMNCPTGVASWIRCRSCVRLKPQSHRIVRLLDRTIGCDLANVRPIGNVCYDLQKRSHTAIDFFCWW